MMKSNAHTAKRLAAATVVATGIAILWAVVLGWCVLIEETLISRRPRSHDAIDVAANGTPVISTTKTIDGVSVVTDRRTLEGKPWQPTNNDRRDWLGSDYFPQPFASPGLVETPLPWNQGAGRLAGLPDGKEPPTAWWFIRDNDRTGKVYLAGYDGISKMPIGYIGQTGFQASKPPKQDQFAVPKSSIDDGFRFLIQGNHYFTSRQLVYYYDKFEPNRVYLLDTGHLWEINLQERTVQSRRAFNQALSMGRVRVSKATFDQLMIDAKKPKSVSTKTDQQAANDKISAQTDDQNPGEDPTWNLWAVRQPDRVTFFTIDTHNPKTFVLPEGLRNRRFSLWLVSVNQMLIDAPEQGLDEYWSGGPVVRLFWIDPKGNIQREKEVRLAGATPAPPRTVAWRVSALIPVSVVWIIGMVLGGPLYLLQTNYFSSFGSALAFVAGFAWPALIVVLLIASGLAWKTRQLQRKRRRSATSTWATFVFLFGVPGFLAYLIEHRRPKLEACPQCGEIVPRDRDACAACTTEFAPPARLGTEIFA